MSPNIVLASTSPYRKELLSRLGMPFITANPKTDESPLDDESPTSLATRLSLAKAQAAALDHPDALIIGSDQVAISQGKVFGKPGNHINAVTQLKELSGQTVHFYSALTLLNSRTGSHQTQCVLTKVGFRSLTDLEIERYVRLEQPFNCAGAAKSEGLGISLLEKIEGDDPNALIGLPLIALCNMLRNEGVSLP